MSLWSRPLDLDVRHPHSQPLVRFHLCHFLSKLGALRQGSQDQGPIGLFVRILGMVDLEERPFPTAYLASRFLAVRTACIDRLLLVVGIRQSSPSDWSHATCLRLSRKAACSTFAAAHHFLMLLWPCAQTVDSSPFQLGHLQRRCA